MTLHELPNELEDCVFEIECEINVPLMAQEEQWQRFQFNSADIFLVFNQLDLGTLWQLIFVMMLLMPIPFRDTTPIGCRVGYVGVFDLGFVSKRPIQTHVLPIITQPYIKRSIPTLCTEIKDHVPSLPLLPMHTDIFREWLTVIPERPPSFCWCVRYNKSYTYQNKEYVPVEKVVKSNAKDKILFIGIGHHPQNLRSCLATAPVNVYVDDVSWQLTTEAFFVYACNKRKAEE